MHADKESGVLRTTVDQSRRPAAAVLLCGAVLAMPLLLIQSGADAAPPDHSGSNGHHPSADAAPLVSEPSASEVAVGAVHGGSSQPSPPGPQPTAAPVRAAVQTQAESTLTAENVASHAALPDVATTTTPVPPTTTAPPLTTTTTTRPPPSPVDGSIHRGQVTYYAHPAGRCASPTLPFGTVVRITNPANGRSVSCIVDDREADTERSIDLATGTFALIAPLSQGVIDAELSW
jgi:rare lipoprotein A